MEPGMSIEGSAMSAQMAFATRPQIEDVVRDDELASGIRDAGLYLARMGLTDIFGFSALHQHFEVGPDEALLQATDTHAGLITAQVVDADAVADSMAVTWQVAADGTSKPTRWCADCSHATSELSQIRRGLLLVGGFLAGRKLTDRLDIQLVHGHLELDAEFGLLESTDYARRTQTTRPWPLAQMPSELAATWLFDPKGKIIYSGWCTGSGGFHPPKRA
jgi:hypothetical protein